MDSFRCASCAVEFKPGRPWQRYCSLECQNKASVKRHRRKKCYLNAITSASTSFLEAPEPPSESYGWGKAGDPPLLGDDYLLEYYEDGYPKLPDILKRPLH
jgi:hypothetical protein